MDIFLATELTEGKQELMDDERIKIRWFTAEELAAMIETDQIQDAKTLIGYYTWRNQLPPHS
jgi:ADP-ribose pyrophosphatase